MFASDYHTFFSVAHVGRPTAEKIERSSCFAYASEPPRTENDCVSAPLSRLVLGISGSASESLCGLTVCSSAAAEHLLLELIAVY